MSNQPDGKSSGGRLPSFKGPRDLSLSSLTLTSTSPKSRPSPSKASAGVTSTPLPPTIARPKRVFKPNIPPKRDKDVKSGDNSGEGSSSSSQPLDKSQQSPSIPWPPYDPQGQNRGQGQSQNQRGGRGGGTPPRGRGRGGRGRGGNLIQSSSVFAEGIGDPTHVKPGTRSRGGGSRGRSGGGGGHFRTSSRLEGAYTREKLEDIIKLEAKAEPHLTEELNDVLDCEEDDKEDGSSGFEQFELEDEAVVLPLTNYLPKLRIKRKTPKFQPGGNLPGPSKSFSQPNLIPERDVVEVADFLSVIGKSRTKPVLCLFQLPSHLPVLMEQEKRQLASSLETLPEGRIGKMQFLADGRCRFVLENSQQGGEKNVFDVEPGKPIGFRQDLVSIDVENTKLVELGPVQHKFVITPDIETLMLSMS